MRRAVITVLGRVKGPTYRAFAASEARRMRITGYISDRPERGVTIIAEGEEKDLLHYTHVLRATGHPYIQVTSLDVRWEPANGSFCRFSIRGTGARRRPTVR